MTFVLRFAVKTLLLILLFCGPVRAAETLAYYSDYFSFVGQDEKGFLLFALDNNRGVDAGDFQAEHFGVMYDQHQGWVDLVGLGEYSNPTGILSRIPDSVAFKFSGKPSEGITILSRVNDLRLEINPLPIRLQDHSGLRRQSWSSAAAVLYWQGRTIPGRIVYEHLVQHNWNRLTHSYSGTWDNFQGFYLAVQQGPPALWKDIYLRSEGKKKTLRTLGFVAASNKQAEIFSPDLKITRKSWALGFYRWGKSWQMSLQQAATEQGLKPAFASIRLRQISRQNISNWVLGGFAMTVVEGTLEQEGHQLKVLGFAELIK